MYKSEIVGDIRVHVEVAWNSIDTNRFFYYLRVLICDDDICAFVK